MAKRETKPKPLFGCGLHLMQKDGNFLGNIIVHLQLKIFYLAVGVASDKALGAGGVFRVWSKL